ncbi:MAG TPA: transketolase C-terminal domain-containing protein [Spirochaetia bacterium]|nr:transketolase C-terminal domain-containing protein [Spirochaetales bacterium]HRY79243.1 transketolase C-terminal domain-containing protein [Spirochaetia bacterium]
MADREMRAVYAQTLTALAASDRRICVVEADLARATGTGPFAKAYPDRFFNVGVAEANLVGVASGLSAAGKRPFAATFACFASRRAYDQFFLSANYAGLEVVLVGTDPGVTAAFNGGTHMPLEDLALMRAVPGLAIVEPADPVSLEAAVKLALERKGCTYLRLQRKPAPEIYGAGEAFEFGKAKLLRPGKDVVLAALGALMVGEARKAADSLAAEGIDAAVVDVFTLAPLDRAVLLDLARKTGRIVTCENHRVTGGLGSAVAELLAEEGVPARLARIGAGADEFGEVGTQDWLAERFRLTAPHIAAAARRLVKGV